MDGMVGSISAASAGSTSGILNGGTRYPSIRVVVFRKKCL
jgi:hypothetical protein